MRRTWQRLVASLRPAATTTRSSATPPRSRWGWRGLPAVLAAAAPAARLAARSGLLLLAARPLIEIAEILLFQRLVDDVLVPVDFRPLSSSPSPTWA